MSLVKPAIEACLCCAIDGWKIFFPTRKMNFLVRGYCLVDYTASRLKTFDHFLKLSLAPGSSLKAKFEWPQADGWTPLNYAVSNEAEIVVDELLRAGFDVVVGSRDPLEQAILGGYHRIVKLLLRQNSSSEEGSPGKELSKAITATTELKQNSSWEWELAPSPQLLSKAMRYYDEELCSSILSRGLSVNVDLPDCSECPVRPVFRAIQLRNSYCLKFFVSVGASLEDSQCRKFPFGLQNIVSLLIWYDFEDGILECVLDVCLAQKVW